MLVIFFETVSLLNAPQGALLFCSLPNLTFRFDRYHMFR